MFAAIEAAKPGFLALRDVGESPTWMFSTVLLSMTSATLLANNIYRPLRRQADSAHIARVAKWMVPIVMLLAVWFTLRGGQTIVSMLLMAYALVTQLFPVLVASLLRNNPVTRVAAFASILVGKARWRGYR